MFRYSWIASLLLAAMAIFAATPTLCCADSVAELRIMSWNIWHGGKEDGAEIGPQRVVDVIRDSGADIVAMQETYGSGELIAKELGFHFHPRGTNLSILSRYPVVEDISVFEDFKCDGAIIELPGGKHVAFYSIWLPYNADIWLPGTRDTSDPQSLLDACEASAVDLKKIQAAIDQRLNDPKYSDIPIFIAGDFNSMSHLDWSEVSVDQYGAAIQWPTSQVLIDAGYRDSYREVNPFVDRKADRTWSPRFPDQEQERIDFIYYRSDAWQATKSRIIDQHADKFPSDHAAVLTQFKASRPPEAETNFRVVSYNIKHGHGMDGVVDLNRTAAVLEKLHPDFVGLQEVDQLTSRSGNVNEPAELGKQLGMHAAFGSFMDYQGGRYGMAVLSRHPIEHVTSVPLPAGKEPRIALAVQIHMPGGDPLMIVNVHFDWIGDDQARFAQATQLAEYLDDLEMPFILLGDFNDGPDSRTLDLLREGKLEAKKPVNDRFTFSSTQPKAEIDFIFAAPPAVWKIRSTTVIDEPLASDHRPVMAEMTLDNDE